MTILHEFAELVLRSELVAVSRQVLEGPPEFAVRRALELASLALGVRVVDDAEGEKRRRVNCAGKKRKARIVSFRIDEDGFTLLDALSQLTSCSRGEVLRRCLTGAQLKSTVDAQALTEVSRVHAISLDPNDRRLERGELQQIVERLVDALAFSQHQYIAVRHDDTDHEHIHVAINKIHPETFRIHSPAWDHQKLFTGARALERELGLTPLRSRTRDREHVPRRAADCEAHHGLESFARWAGEKLRPALRRTELRSWNDVHDVCGRLGVVIRPHGNGLIFEDVDRGVRVKASFVARDLSKARLCKQLGSFQPASERHVEAARHAPHRYSPMPTRVPQSLWKEYEQSLA